MIKEIMYKFITWLPFIACRAFDHDKLTPLLQKLDVDASMNMDNWYTVDYDSNWSVGLKYWGGTVILYIYLQNKTRKPTPGELTEVILALPNKYKYDKAAFEPDKLDGFTLRGILSSDL